MSFASALYPGVVVHARTRPRKHRLRYRVFMLLIDLDEVDAQDRRLRLFSVRRPNLIGFDPRRHGDGSARPLKDQVAAILAGAGIDGGGAIRMLTLPTVLGHGFNPLTVYFCHRSGGALSAILYEVSNTFGERHSYLIPAGALEGDAALVRQGCDKGFYVSPFMDMDLSYAFRIRPPGEEVVVKVDARDDDGVVLAASFAGRRVELSDAALLRAWLGHPWMSLGVLAAIHWEALKIWLKGERLRPRPPKPARPVTVVAA
ncbi:DUF1365 domain-containing protein [Phenylobacterium sp.]|uniref:DUF1365 domain-containing protein n=1 Tax=Phenylobacterium sp. TaxID=1871053 RepID=UPI0039399C38